MSKIDQLKYLLEKNKFSYSEWEKRGLNPSASELCEYLENNLNSCLNSLIDKTKNNASRKELKKTLSLNLRSLNKSNLDTEEKEFVCYYYNDFSKIVEVDFKSELNNWLYGTLFNLLIKITKLIKGKEKIIETLVQNCTNCNSKLETFILEKNDEILDSGFFIVRCKSCREYNLIEKGSKIKRLRFGEYELTEQLAKKDYNLEGAKIRLKQIQFFRK
jgi:hypothetical protein